MNTILKRIVALVLCVVMIAGYMPVNAFADGTGETVAAAAAEATTEPSVVAAAEEPAAETTEEKEPEKINDIPEEKFEESASIFLHKENIKVKRITLE